MMAVIIRVERWFVSDTERDGDFEHVITVFGVEREDIERLLHYLGFRHWSSTDEWSYESAIEYVVTLEDIDESSAVLVGNKEVVMPMLEGVLTKFIRGDVE